MARTRSRGRGSRVGALLLAGGLLLGACASEGTESSSSATDGGAARQSTVQPGWVNKAEPTSAKGGTLEVSLPAAVPGLDPTIATAGLATQGLVLTALYDSLLRWDPETGKYEGQLAESIAASDDLTTWTLKLRPGLTFTDSTPLDADAVVYSVKRMAKARGAAGSYTGYVASYATPDPLTVVFTLKEPLSNFDAVLSAELGFMVSPTAAEADPEGFNKNPVGAGPFKLTSFDPNSELVLSRNPSYALGEPPLDAIRYTWNPEQEANLEKLTAGQADLTVLTSVPNAVRAIEAGFPTRVTPVPGYGMAVNSAAGRKFPGNDVRVRRAISLAIDRQAVNDRVNEGNGFIGDWLFPEGSPLHVDASFGPYDPAEAKRLVEEVKAETGWDGSFTLLTPPPIDTALAYQAFLNAAGFNVNVEQAKSFTELATAVAVSKDFDLAVYGMTIYPNTVYQTLSRSLATGSPSNYASFSSSRLDQLLAEMRVAPAAEMPELLTRMAEIFNDEVPFVLSGASTYSMVVDKTVGGLTETSLGLVLFGDTFKA